MFYNLYLEVIPCVYLINVCLILDIFFIVPKDFEITYVDNFTFIFNILFIKSLVVIKYLF